MGKFVHFCKFLHLFQEKLEKLLQFLLQYVHDQAAQFDPELKEDEEETSSG